MKNFFLPGYIKLIAKCAQMYVNDHDYVNINAKDTNQDDICHGENE